MSARPKPAQSEFLDDSLPVKLSAEPAPIRLADLKNDQLPSGRLSLGNLDPLGRLGRLEPLAFGLTRDGYDLRTTKAGVAVSGEITLHGDRLYVQVSQPATGHDSRILFRTCEGREARTGLMWCSSCSGAVGQTEIGGDHDLPL